ncbi:MAG: ATP synthase F0 subunit B [Candidatus Eremiobacteraeota bacterium]|nr:ATP synthase F0 subunit B [Candidatus Eremiobacteraeota bacterium]
MFLSLDGTFVIQLANFAVFFALLNVLFLKPVGQAIRKRRSYLNGLVSEYDAHQAEATALREKAELVRAQARRDAELTLSRARAETSNATSELAARYAAQVASTIETAQRQAAGELRAARTNEEQLVARLADALVERAVAETVS